MNRFAINQTDMTEGPLGFPMISQAAKSLEVVLRSLPRDTAFAYRKATIAPPTVLTDESTRSDISWITSEEPDREGDIVRAGGLDDSQYRLNPVVTLNHDYRNPPVGYAAWWRFGVEGPRRGVMAKTIYPAKPSDWADSRWPPDDCFSLVKAGLLRGKSIGFLPLSVRSPSAIEIRDDPRLSKVRHLIERWLLLEYACCSLPVQPFAVVTDVGETNSDALTQLATLDWVHLGQRIARDRLMGICG